MSRNILRKMTFESSRYKIYSTHLQYIVADQNVFGYLHVDTVVDGHTWSLVVNRDDSDGDDLRHLMFAVTHRHLELVLCRLCVVMLVNDVTTGCYVTQGEACDRHWVRFHLWTKKRTLSECRVLTRM